MQLRDPALLRQQLHINGQWCAADDKACTAVIDPASGAHIATVPTGGAAETERAIEAAEGALPGWRALAAKERSAVLQRWFALMIEHQEDLALILASEQGKPMAEARGEIAYAASFIEWFAEEAKRVYGELVPGHARDKRIMVMREPIGVCAAITPWNFPSAMITRKCGPALAAGCTMVLKPAGETPLSALALAEIATRAGLPAGVFNVVCGGAEAVGGAMTASPAVRKLSFTGSTEIGSLLMAQCAGTVKKVSMELGGNAPFLVFDDADLDAAVAGAMASKFRNTGQTCVCTNRFIVQDRIYPAFCDRLAAAAEALRVGPACEGDNQQGPLINDAALAKVESHVADALAKGARLLTGGARHPRGGRFYQPTVLTEVSTAMQLSGEETFGPVAPVFRFHQEDEGIALANDTPYGLAAYFYTRDLNRTWRVAEALQSGIVGVNEGIISTEVAPFGGVKASGVGREGSRHGIEDYLEMKYVCIGGVQ